MLCADALQTYTTCVEAWTHIVGMVNKCMHTFWAAINAGLQHVATDVHTHTYIQTNNSHAFIKYTWQSSYSLTHTHRAFVDWHWLLHCWQPEPLHLHEAQGRRTFSLALLHRRMIGSGWCAATRWNVTPPELNSKEPLAPDASAGYKAPLNFTFCLDPIFVTDISESDPYLMPLWRTHSKMTGECRLLSPNGVWITGVLSHFSSVI